MLNDDVKVRIGYIWGLKTLAKNLAKARAMLHKDRMGFLTRRPVVILPVWKWWEINKWGKANRERYKRRREARKRRCHYEWVSEPLRRNDVRVY